MALSRVVSEIFNVEKYRDIEIPVKSQSRSFDRLVIVSYFIVTLSLPTEIFDFKNAVTLKTGLRVRQGYWKCHHSIERMTSYWHSIVNTAISLVVSEIFNVGRYSDLEITVRGQSRSLKEVYYSMHWIWFPISVL